MTVRVAQKKFYNFYVQQRPADSLEELDLSSYRKKSKFTYRVARYLGKVQLTAFRRVGNVARAWDAPFAHFNNDRCGPQRSDVEALIDKCSSDSGYHSNL
jgi:hypothetical protein